MDICELSRTCHISDLRKRFLSLRALEAQGCKFSDADRDVKVIEGSLTIFK